MIFWLICILFGVNRIHSNTDIVENNKSIFFQPKMLPDVSQSWKSDDLQMSNVSRCMNIYLCHFLNNNNNNNKSLYISDMQHYGITPMNGCWLLSHCPELCQEFHLSCLWVCTFHWTKGQPQRVSYLFSWLLHLHQDGDNEKNKNYAWWDTNDSAMGLSDLMKKPLRSLLWRQKRLRRKEQGIWTIRRCRRKIPTLKSFKINPN